MNSNSEESSSGSDTTLAQVLGVLDLDLPGPTISRHVYGHFAEHLGRCIYGGFYVGEDSRSRTRAASGSDVVEALRALDIPNLRWPGGCFADEYHWQDGIGPREAAAHDGQHPLGRRCGGQPLRHPRVHGPVRTARRRAVHLGNVGSGTVQEMSEWVEYLTRADDSPMARLRRQNGREEPWRVRSGVWATSRGAAAATCAPSSTPISPASTPPTAATTASNRLYRIAAGAADADYALDRGVDGGLVRDLGWRTRGRHGKHPYQADLVPLLHACRDPGSTRAAPPSSTGEEYYRTMHQGPADGGASSPATPP